MSKDVPKEILNLIQLTLPHQVSSLNQDKSLESIVKITTEWNLNRELRLDQALLNKCQSFHNEIINVEQILGLRESKMPSFSTYDSVAIFGSTGLSHFKIWKDLIILHKKYNIQFSKIFLLGGDRVVNKKYDSLTLALKYFPQYFLQTISDEELFKCSNEMEIMQLITSAIKLPDTLKSIPIYSVFTPRNQRLQSDTKDTILQLLKTQTLSFKLPILFLGTLPYIVRQGIQARCLMSDYQVDIASIFEPYLETIETPLKGNLPSMLYLDELHWLFLNMKKNSLSFDQI